MSAWFALSFIWVVLDAEERWLGDGVPNTCFLGRPPSKCLASVVLLCERIREIHVCRHLQMRNCSARRMFLGWNLQLLLRFYSLIPFCLFSWWETHFYFSPLSSTSIADHKELLHFIQPKLWGFFLCLGCYSSPAYLSDQSLFSFWMILFVNKFTLSWSVLWPLSLTATWIGALTAII